ncbi:DedA family protein [Streptomyces meridianus]|uniref:VTT domain-containing protein n=1 Tax=Streptomyces meridianus TaxID=2938945 RepID=A0ABT0X049_9ACTN|nr:VTT domain-containing protein [Streptomyces meridianus]MCM2575934.1 VTT domain-containing protein [Streptomyces meridianus]
MQTLGTYLVLAATTAPPLVPNAGILVAAGVLASHGRLNIVVVLLVVAGSAVLGDLAIHWFGSRFRRPVHGWARRTTRRRTLLAWTTEQIHRYGVPFVIAVRFLPSGRLIGGLAAGVTGYPRRRYLVGAVIAESIWASYSVFLGYLGSAVAENRFYAASIGFAISAVVAGAGLLVQRSARRRVSSREAAEAAAAENAAPGRAGTGSSGPGNAGTGGGAAGNAGDRKRDDGPGASGPSRGPGGARPLGIGERGGAADD